MEDVFANLVNRIDSLIKLQKDNEVRFARLAESQLKTDRRLEVLIEMVSQGFDRKPRLKK